MQEKVLSNRKNGMAMMLLFLFLYAAAVTVFVLGSVFIQIPLIVIGSIWTAVG